MSPTPLLDRTLRRQMLSDTAVALHDDPEPLDAAIRERQHSHTGHDYVELHALLRAACWLDADTLARHLTDIADAQAAVERHGQTDHGECCQGECPCTRHLERCSTCEDRPHEQLDQQIDLLLHHLRVALGAAAVAEYLEAA